VLGVLFIFWTHRASATEDLDLNRLEETDPVYGYQVLLIAALHSASEGVAIGVAMVASVPFGIFMALAIGLHNIPEGTILCAVLRSRGVRLGEATWLAVASNVSQVLLAVVTYSVVVAAPGLLAGALGLAIGALVYLVFVELLPESYREAGPTSIALVTTVAIGALVLLRELVG
jgi:ZIP family zinc transporter